LNSGHPLSSPGTYRIPRIASHPGWGDAAWQHAPSAAIAHFHPRSSDHRPRVEFRVLYDPQHLYVLFDVDDRWVVARHTAHQQKVFQDSCVEFFVRPRPDCGYFNFETNCGGWMLSWYVEDPTPVGDRCRRQRDLSETDLRQIEVYRTMPSRLEPEVADPVRWKLGLSIPFGLLEKYVGRLGDPAGRRWDANFFKCADGCSKPHWAAWSPIAEELNFHQPRYFGSIEFIPGGNSPA
jgi:hypothetical protein